MYTLLLNILNNSVLQNYSVMKIHVIFVFENYTETDFCEYI